jgi:hypothetical protein
MGMNAVRTVCIDATIKIRTQNNNYDDVELYRTNVTNTVQCRKNKAMMNRKDTINNTVVKILM